MGVPGLVPGGTARGITPVWFLLCSSNRREGVLSKHSPGRVIPNALETSTADEALGPPRARPLSSGASRKGLLSVW